MKYNEAPEVNWQSLAVEDTQVRILLVCKRAARELWTRERLNKEVLDLIRELIGDLESENLKARVYLPLMSYAEKTYVQQVRLVREKALFFVLLGAALEKHKEEPRARDYMTVFTRDNSAEFRASAGFRYWESEWRDDPDSYNMALPLGEYHKIYTERVKELTHELVMGEAKEDYGTNVNLRNIAEMTVRYEYQQNMVDKLRNSGTRLVYIVAHANSSERCAKYQVGGSLHPSGLYSLDGTSGRTKEGIPYKPLEFATENPIDRHTTRAGKTYQNGCITGFNCRHKLEAYRPGIEPISIPSEVVERTRALEERQREYERRIRLEKVLYVQTREDSPIQARRHRLAAKALNDKYIEFSKKNKLAYYRERTRIFDNL